MTSSSMVLMPKLGLTMTEGEVAQWCCAPGARFAMGDTIAVIESDKVAHDLEAPRDGVLDEILIGEGKAVPVSIPIARWTLDALPNSASQPAPRVTEAADEIAATEPADPGRMVAGGKSDRRFLATPFARRLAAGNGIDLSEVTGTGPGGRIKACDVERRVADRHSLDDLRASSLPTARDLVAGSASNAAEGVLAGLDFGSPPFQVAARIDASMLLDVQQQLRSCVGLEQLALTPLVLLAVVRASESDWGALDRDGIPAVKSLDIALAVNVDGVPIMPVLRDLAGKSLRSISAAIAAMTDRILAGQLAPIDLGGEAIAVLHDDLFDVDFLPPAATADHGAVLTIGRVSAVFRPDAGGVPVLRREIGLVLSASRGTTIGDGAPQFLGRVRQLLEDPLVMLAT